MGYCTYTENKRTGGVVVAWIGTGTDEGRQKTISYSKSARLANIAEDKKLKCADARRQFCKEYTGNDNCNVRTAADRPSRGGGASSSPTATPETVTKNATDIKDTGGNKQEDAERKRYCKEVCAKSCGLNPFCHYAKWDCECGGDITGIFGECKIGPLPPPFNDCFVLGGIALAGILAIWILK